MSFATTFADYTETNPINEQYDIQGQVTSVSDVNKPYKGPFEASPSDYKEYQLFSADPTLSAAGTGDALIPATSPGLQLPTIPQIPPYGNDNPMSIAVNANVASIKEINSTIKDSSLSTPPEQADIMGYDTLSDSYGTM